MATANLFLLVNALLSVFTILIGVIASYRLRDSILFLAGVCIVITGIMACFHSAIMVFGLSFEIYAVTSLVSTMMLGFTVAICGVIIKIARSG